MVIFTKVGCIVLYALGVASLLGLLPESWHFVALAAAFVLGAHVVEAVVMFKHVRRYKGSLVISILQTLLFGFLHWKPIADKKRSSATRLT